MCDVNIIYNFYKKLIYIHIAIFNQYQINQMSDTYSKFPDCINNNIDGLTDDNILKNMRADITDLILRDLIDDTKKEIYYHYNANEDFRYQLINCAYVIQRELFCLGYECKIESSMEMIFGYHSKSKWYTINGIVMKIKKINNYNITEPSSSDTHYRNIEIYRENESDVENPYDEDGYDSY